MNVIHFIVLQEIPESVLQQIRRGLDLCPARVTLHEPVDEQLQVSFPSLPYHEWFS